MNHLGLLSAFGSFGQLFLQGLVNAFPCATPDDENQEGYNQTDAGHAEGHVVGLAEGVLHVAVGPGLHLGGVVDGSPVGVFIPPSGSVFHIGDIGPIQAAELDLGNDRSFVGIGHMAAQEQFVAGGIQLAFLCQSGGLETEQGGIVAFLQAVAGIGVQIGIVIVQCGEVVELYVIGRNGGIVGITVLFEEVVIDGVGHARGEECSDVDEHVENGESDVAVTAVFGVVVKVADQGLEVTFEASCPDCNQCQGGEHDEFARHIGIGRHRKQQITAEHDDETDQDGLSVTQYLVGDDTAQEGEEVHSGEENAVNHTGCGARQAEFRLHEQGQDGKHGVIAEAFSHVGQRKDDKSFGVSF